MLILYYISEKETELFNVIQLLIYILLKAIFKENPLEVMVTLVIQQRKTNRSYGSTYSYNKENRRKLWQHLFI